MTAVLDPAPASQAPFSASSGVAVLGRPLVPGHGRRLSAALVTASVLGCTALGLALVALADQASRADAGYQRASIPFWCGLLLLFVPTALRTLSPSSGRRERLALVVVLGLALFAVKLLASPTEFVFGDEFIHLRSAQDILRTGHAFGLNPLLPTAAYYPGLAALTAGLVQLTGLSIFAAGVVVIGLARVLISASIFLVAERVSGSSRAAAAASLLYAANPMFLFWSSTFSYENLALPLASFVVWWIAVTRRRGSRLVPLVSSIVIVAIVMTHHVVGFALAALLCAWWIAERFSRRPADRQPGVGAMALVASVFSVGWILVVARPAITYLVTDNVVPALRQTADLLLGGVPVRHLYASGGLAPPVWEPVAGAAAIGVLLVALPVALYRAWVVGYPPPGVMHDRRRRDRVPMAVAIIVAAAFPLALAPRLTYIGVAVSGRSMEYIFTGLCCVLCLLSDRSSRWRRKTYRHHPARSGPPDPRRMMVVTALLTVVFVGDVTIGTAFYQRLPEPATPNGYPWTVQPDVVQASTWAREHLGLDQSFGATAIDATALATSGGQRPVDEQVAWPIFFAPTMDSQTIEAIRSSGVRYLLLDWRTTKGVPGSPGYYFSPYEPGATQYDQAFPASALQKFLGGACTSTVYDSGVVKIVDVSAIAANTCTSGAALASAAGAQP